MTKSELIRAAAQRSGATMDNTKKVLDAAFDVIMEELGKGEKVRLPGFGTFEIRTIAQRKGFNPQTQQPITIPESRRAAFRPGEAFKKIVG